MKKGEKLTWAKGEIELQCSYCRDLAGVTGKETGSLYTTHSSVWMRLLLGRGCDVR